MEVAGPLLDDATLNRRGFRRRRVTFESLRRIVKPEAPSAGRGFSSFGFIDPWPVAWYYTDDVYVAYDNGGYYVYNPAHPGVRISVNIL